LEFQFESGAGNPGEFQILRSATVGDRTSWQLATDGVVEAVVEGRFRASVSVAGQGLGFVKVRWTGLPAMGPAAVINEVMSDNRTAHGIGDGLVLDWIELFNPHDEAVNLRGYTLTDDALGVPQWVFPEVILQPGAFRMVYAAGDLPGGVMIEGVLLANLGLRSGGETLILSDPFGREVDRLVLPPLDVDQSVGRSPDGGPVWQFYAKAQATPGAANPTVGEGVSVPPPDVSMESGSYDGPISVRMTSRVAGGRIRFTTDGTPPTLDSQAAGETAIPVVQSMVLRAATYDGEGRRSEETARTYLVGVRHTLPVVSMSAPAANFEFRNGYLFGMGGRVLSPQGAVLETYPFSGSNAWQDREVEVQLELLEPGGKVGLRQRAGIKVYGGWGSRGYPQKSLALFARRQYGAGRFDHEVFPGGPLDTFESLVLRNSGNDNQSTHQIPPRPPITAFGATQTYGSYFVNGTFTLLRDAMMQRLLSGYTPLDTQAYRPAVVYLNGEYWGIYNLREKLNEHHVRAHHELPEGSIDLIEGYGDIRAGDSRVYRAMRDFVGARNMAVQTNFQFVADTYLDIDNFIDYNLAVIYFQNFDIGNIKCWRPRTPTGRFRWLVYDQDYGFGLWPAGVYEPAMARDYADYANMFRFATAGTGTSTGWPNAGGRTLLLRRLLANPGFRERFILRCADLLNSAFRESRVEGIIQDMAAVIRPEIGAHLKRWSWEELRRRGYAAPYKPEFQSFTQATWETNLSVLVDFARARPGKLRADCRSHFSLNGGQGDLEIEVEPEGAGVVRVNTLRLDSYPWRGTYFSDLTNTLRVVAKPGYRFREWRTPSGTAMESVLRWKVANGATQRIVAQLEPVSQGAIPKTRLWITEIQYRAPDDLDSDDWVEIHNPGDQAVNLEGWTVRDESDSVACVLPPVVLEPGGYRVMARSLVKFQWAYPDAKDPIAALNFGLGNGGDVVRLYDPEGVPVVRIPYGDEAPWPVSADGRGSTLQLAHPERSHESFEAWEASVKRGGTPGGP